MKRLIISVDFDSTVTKFSVFHRIGNLRHEARDVINHLYQSHTIIINTCRSGDDLNEAIQFLNDNGVKFHLVNKNAMDNIEKFGRDTRKIYADLHIDDKNIGRLNWHHVIPVVNKLSKPTILCLVGESGSGKSAVADYINTTYGISTIQSRTTRAPRYVGERGHLFVSDEEFSTYKPSDMLAFTSFGKKKYCCLKDDLNFHNVYVIDENGLDYLLSNFKDDYNIFSIRTSMPKEKRAKYAGEDRMLRDIGMFNTPIDRFSFVLNTGQDKQSTFMDVDDIISEIFTNKLYSHE